MPFIKKTTFLLYLLVSFLISSKLYSAEIPIVIYHTNDLHSHLDGVKIPHKNGYERRGGFARLQSAINEIKNTMKDHLVIGVDAGDFFSGTIFSGLAVSEETSFPEYDFFIDNQYDLITLGNHEFDAHNKGLEMMLKKMSTRSPLIPLVSSNLTIVNNSSLKKYYGENQIIRPYLIKDYSHQGKKIRIGFLGILGPDGCLVSRSTRGDAHFIGFNEDRSKMDVKALSKHIDQMASKLKKEKSVDLVILSMHGGGKESYDLAAGLSHVDALIAGHTHKQEFAIINDIVVNQTGSYGENLGFLKFFYNPQTKKLKIQDEKANHVLTITEAIKPDVSLQQKIESYRKKSFQLMGQTNNPDEVVFTPKNDYQRSSKIGNPMGQLVTNSLYQEINSHYLKNDPIDLYITSMGLVRTSFYKNIPYTRAEIFEAVSIGFDERMRPGVDVVTFYLSPKEVKTIIQFMEIYTFISTSFSPAFSESLTFNIRKWGIPFLNRIYDLKLHGKDLSDYDRPIKIATNKFIVMNIETVKKISRGFIELIPKDKSGQPLKQFESLPKEYEIMTHHLMANPHKY